jgi:hypothetical protein
LGSLSSIPDVNVLRIHPPDHVLAPLRRSAIILRVKSVGPTKEAQRGEELLRFRLLSSLVPAIGRELENLALFPRWQEADTSPQLSNRGLKARIVFGWLAVRAPRPTVAGDSLLSSLTFLSRHGST